MRVVVVVVVDAERRRLAWGGAGTSGSVNSVHILAEKVEASFS